MEKGSTPELSTLAASYKFPEALLSRSKCLIALSGLDILNNAVHRLVWEEFTKQRPDKKPISYKNVPADHLYPKSSGNRTTYDDYSPLGILKTTWLTKHTEEVPALVGFFFDLDWEDPLWDERQTECVSKVEVIRTALQNRASEIVLVLLQSSPPMPAGDASTAHSDKAAALCAACELQRLNLFVLPFSQRPQGFIARIEEAFYKKAVLYYNNQVHTVRAHKDMISTRQSLQLLNIRHQFKIAFFSEMKQDSVAALRLYNVAYSYVLETMYLSEDRIMEFKMISGFLNYKICQLYFETDEPLSAIGQFRKHIDRFMKEYGPKQLVYEHAEWMSRQFSAFADLFSDATRRGLKGLQTQNPGLYYQHASLYAIERKQLSNKLCLEAARVVSSGQVVSDLGVGEGCVYFGQRPWRRGLPDDKPSNMDVRQKCVLAMQAQEYRVEHSWQIIPLLTKATAHYKNHHCNRVITHLKVLMAQEYYLVKDWDKTLVLLSGVCEVYRSEQWWTLLSSILQLALRCSYLLGRLDNYFTIALELTSNYLPLSMDEKKRIQKNIEQLFKGQPPSPESGVDSDSLGGALYKWTNLLQSDIQTRKVKVQMSSLASCIDCKTEFSQSVVTTDSAIEVKVHLHSSAPLPIELSQLKVEFLQEEYNRWCVFPDSFQLEPFTVRTFHFAFPTNQDSVGIKLEIKAVQALYGCVSGESSDPVSDEGCVGVLVWNGGLSEAFTSKPLDLVWQRITSRCSTLINPRPASVDITLSHQPPALTGEQYPIKLSVCNQEAEQGCGPMTNLVITLTLPESLDEPQPPAELQSSLPSTSDAVARKPKNGQSLELSCDQLASGEMFEKTIYLCTRGVGLRKMEINVSYDIACTVREEWEPVMCACQKEHSVTVQAVKPFELLYKLMSTSFQPIESIVYNQPFVLMTEVQCTSPWQLLVVNSQLQQAEGESTVTELGPTASQIEGLCLDPGDRATECRCLTAARSHSGKDSTVAIGTYTIKWKRSSDSDSMDLSSTVTFPAVSAKFHSYSVTADVPASGQLREVLPISYTIHNKTTLIQEFEAKMGTSEAFMYSGNRLARFRILPESEYKVTFNLLPVVTGLVPLPTLDLLHQREGEGQKGSDQNLPTSVFIKPAPLVRMDPDLSISSVS